MRQKDMNYIAELVRCWRDYRHPIEPLSEEEWGPIAAALRAMPVPRRPRDFRLDPRMFAPRPIPRRRLAPVPLIAVVALVAAAGLAGSISRWLPTGTAGPAPVFAPALNIATGSPGSDGAKSLSGSTAAPAPADQPFLSCQTPSILPTPGGSPTAGVSAPPGSPPAISPALSPSFGPTPPSPGAGCQP